MSQLSDLDRTVIKEAWNRSAPIEWLANYYKLTSDEIAKLVGLPKNKRARDKLHRDNCFYSHGYAVNLLDLRAEWMGISLEGDFEKDGDFEKFQPACYMEKNDPKYLALKKEAESIPETIDPISELRRLWILARFVEFQMEDWERIMKTAEDWERMYGWQVYRITGKKVEMVKYFR